MDKKQKITLGVLSVIVVVCLIGLVLVMSRGNENKAAEDNKKQETTKEAAGTDDTSDVSEAQTVEAWGEQTASKLGLSSTQTLDQEKIAYYYELEDADIAECSGVIADVALADELVVIKAASADRVDAVLEGAKKRLESQKESFKDYVPEQYSRLDGAVVEACGDYVIYVCSDHTDEIVSDFETFAGK